MKAAATDRIKILHIITGLNVGGAESVLCKLMEHIDKECFDNAVISLLPEGPLAERIRAAGVPVYSVNFRKSPFALLAFSRLLSFIKKLKPDIVQTWMYHSNLIGGIAGKVFGIRVVWGIHHSNLDPKLNKRTTLWVVKLCALLSRVIPEKIVYCAKVALEVHVQAGYDMAKACVIPNGFDTNVFSPDVAARQSILEELNLPHTVLIVGMVGRFDSQKDHQNFFNAAKIVASKNVNACFVLCGDGIDWKNERLVGMIDPAIRDRVYLLGRRMDMPRMYAALDVFVLSSAGEAFPNVVGEAMACGVPCVVTDVGDVALIVGDSGVVVPPREFSALAEGVLSMLETTERARAACGVIARQRIVEMFDVRVITDQYEGFYKMIASGGRR